MSTCGLDLHSARRERIGRDHIPAAMQRDFRNWSGVKGFRAYNRFVAREWLYHVFRAQRP